MMPMSYRGIADDMAKRIRAGEWPVGVRLPTTEEIATEYGVSEATAYRAASILVDRGLITGTPGRGRFVVPEAIERPTREV
jgi:GntR family transcriptional regulator